MWNRLAVCKAWPGREPETSGIPVPNIVEGQFCRVVTAVQPRASVGPYANSWVAASGPRHTRAIPSKFICRPRDGFRSPAPFNA